MSSRSIPSFHHRKGSLIAELLDAEAGGRLRSSRNALPKSHLMKISYRDKIKTFKSLWDRIVRFSLPICESLKWDIHSCVFQFDIDLVHHDEIIHVHDDIYAPSVLSLESQWPCSIPDRRNLSALICRDKVSMLAVSPRHNAPDQRQRRI